MRQVNQEIAPLVSATEQFYENGLEHELASLRNLFQAGSIEPNAASPYRECEEVNLLLAQSYWLLADTPEFERLEQWFGGAVLGPGEKRREEFLLCAAVRSLGIMQRFSESFPQRETMEEAHLPPRLLGLYKHQAVYRPKWPIRRLVALSAVLELSPAELCFASPRDGQEQAWDKYYALRWQRKIHPSWAVYDMYVQSSVESVLAHYQQVPEEARNRR